MLRTVLGHEGLRLGEAENRGFDRLGRDRSQVSSGRRKEGDARSSRERKRRKRPLPYRTLERTLEVPRLQS